MRAVRHLSSLVLLITSISIPGCSELITPDVTEPEVAELHLEPELMVDLPDGFVQGVPGTITFRINTDTCREPKYTTVDELGLHERLVTAWVGLKERVQSPCLGPEAHFVQAEVTFYSLGPAVVVIRGRGEDLRVRDYEFPTTVSPN